MTQQVYTITIEDVRTYVQSLAPDAPCGTTCDPAGCLVVMAIRQKYPEIGYVESDDCYAYLYTSFEDRHPLGRIEYTRDIETLVMLFDSTDPTGKHPLTRVQVERHLGEVLGLK